MPVVISSNKFYTKNQNGTGYLPANVISTETTETQLARITSEGNTQVTRVQNKANEVTAQLSSSGEMEEMVAVPFVQATAYPTGKFVIHTDVVSGNDRNRLYYLPDGHTANTTWENTTKVGPITMGDQVSNLKSALDDNTDCIQHGLIPYACGGSISNIVTVSQTGNEVTINGTSSATSNQGATKVLISDHLQTWNAVTVPEAAEVYPIKLLSGHTYKIKATIISGTRNKGEGTGNLTFRAYDSDHTLLVSAQIAIDESTGENSFVSAGESVQIRIHVARLMTLTDVVIRIEFSDITEQVAIGGKQDALTFDDFPTENSINPVKSGGVFSELDTIKDVIGTQQTRIANGVESGYYWNSETATAVKTAYSTYKAYGPIEVIPGETYRLYCSYSGNSAKQWPFLFVDDEYTIIDHVGTRNHKVDETVKAPEGASLLLMTCGTGNKCEAYHIALKPIPENILTGTFDFKDKNIAIIGDSISTNGDYTVSNPFGNVPEIVVDDADIGVELSAYVTYYDVGTTIGGHTIVESEVGTELTFTPVDGDQGKIIGKPKNNNTATTDVWWEVAAAVLGFNPIPVCWSGSSITDHEENAQDDGHYIYKCAHSFHPSQIRKCGIRTPGTMERTAPDMIIIYRGTNDLSHSPYSRITDDLDSFPTTYPDADTFDDGGTTRYSFVKGMRILIKKLHEAYPETKIVLCTLNYFRRLSHTAIYTSNGTDNWLKYNAMIRRIADYEGCDLIEFDKDGLNYWNAANGYYNEGTSDTAYWTHPNTKGQARLGSRALVDLRTVNDMTVPT